jgi:hypothetical protein
VPEPAHVCACVRPCVPLCAPVGPFCVPMCPACPAHPPHLCRQLHEVTTTVAPDTSNVPNTVSAVPLSQSAPTLHCPLNYLKGSVAIQDSRSCNKHLPRLIFVPPVCPCVRLCAPVRPVCPCPPLTHTHTCAASSMRSLPLYPSVADATASRQRLRGTRPAGTPAAAAAAAVFSPALLLLLLLVVSLLG